ncbi:MAG: 2-phosphosulfolactate phosphatase, partial [Kangiella sp.]|nr:2-phosphosulfolactate phosphatase [Kangiella sp.]
MRIFRTSLIEGARSARGTAVIIDVYRAFTCAPLLFYLGARRAILVSTPEEAFELKEKDPGLLLIGEIGGVPIEGFDFGNSPSQILSQAPSTFNNKTVVQRTSSGVQGALAAINVADEVLLGSYALGGAIA